MGRKKDTIQGVHAFQLISASSQKKVTKLWSCWGTHQICTQLIKEREVHNKFFIFISFLSFSFIEFAKFNQSYSFTPSLSHHPPLLTCWPLFTFFSYLLYYYPYSHCFIPLLPLNPLTILFFYLFHRSLLPTNVTRIDWAIFFVRIKFHVVCFSKKKRINSNWFMLLTWTVLLCKIRWLISLIVHLTSQVTGLHDSFKPKTTLINHEHSIRNCKVQSLWTSLLLDKQFHRSPIFYCYCPTWLWTSWSINFKFD